MLILGEACGPRSAQSGSQLPHSKVASRPLLFQVRSESCCALRQTIGLSDLDNSGYSQGWNFHYHSSLFTSDFFMAVMIFSPLAINPRQ
jgi:hypothetical protein